MNVSEDSRTSSLVATLGAGLGDPFLVHHLRVQDFCLTVFQQDASDRTRPIVGSIEYCFDTGQCAVVSRRTPPNYGIGQHAEFISTEPDHQGLELENSKLFAADLARICAQVATTVVVSKIIG